MYKTINAQTLRLLYAITDYDQIHTNVPAALSFQQQKKKREKTLSLKRWQIIRYDGINTSNVANSLLTQQNCIIR